MRAKRKDAACVGSTRMMVGTFGISQHVDDDESACVRAHARLPNSAGGDERRYVYRRGRTRAERL